MPEHRAKAVEIRRQCRAAWLQCGSGVGRNAGSRSAFVEGRALALPVGAGIQSAGTRMRIYPVPASGTVPWAISALLRLGAVRAVVLGPEGAPQEESHAMTAPRPRSRQPKATRDLPGESAVRPAPRPPRQSGPTPRQCSGFAAALSGHGLRTGTRSPADIQRWMAWLLGRYAPTPATSTGLQQFFKWLAAGASCPTRWPGAAAARPGQAGPGLHLRGAEPAGAGVRGPQFRPAPRYRDHRGAHRDRHPAVRTGRPAIR
jgi:hypothetical protein